MNHNYRLTDFVIVKESDTDIYETIVSVDLSNVQNLPATILQRLEKMINYMITDHEQNQGIMIPLEKMELGIFMNVNTSAKELSLNAYVGYSLDADCITGKDVINNTDEDYSNIKNYFFERLNKLIFEQVKEIEMCC